MKKLVVKDKSLCQACLSCELACSEAFYKKNGFSCISIGLNKKNTLDVKACNQCGVCAKKCPEEAISKNTKGVANVNMFCPTVLHWVIGDLYCTFVVT